MASSRDRDIQNPLAPVVRLLKRKVAQVRPDTVLQHLDIQEVSLLPEPSHSTNQSRPRVSPPRISLVPPFTANLARKGREVNSFAAQDMQQFLLRVDGHESGNQSSGSRARDDSREQSSKKQRLGHTKMTETENSAALKYEGRPSESLSGIVDEIELHLCRHVAHSIADTSASRRTVPTVLAIVRTRQAGTNRSCSSESGCKTVVGVVVGSGPPGRR